MRILAIRGENLASLSRRFEIDLSDGPLAGAGLFAITGETGAGKSTILDALCLALYGEYPRVFNGSRSEKAPDPSGPLTSQDARLILRRGAAACWAEVDFEGQDGGRYRARWQVARARGRSDGNLQAEQRLLLALPDEWAVAQGRQAVKEAVTARTDLTFDQFRRTVLLPQGEFDAFLMADASTRAQLLEKITGTDLYARISVAVHRMTAELMQARRDVAARRAAVGLLEAEERAALEARRAALEAELAEIAAARSALAARIALIERIGRARAAVTAAEAALAAAAEAREAAGPEAERLAALDRVEPLRPLREAAERTARELEAAEARLAGLARRQGEARRLHGEALSASAEADAAEAEAAGAVAAHAPAWEKAAGLDRLVDEAGRELTDAEEAAARAAAELARVEAEEGRLAGEAEAARAMLAEAEAKLAAAPERAHLADQIGHLADTARKYPDLAAALRGARAKEADAATAIARIAGESERLGLRRGELSAAIAAIDARLAEIEAARAGLDEAELTAAEEALLAALGELGQARRLAEAEARHKRAAEAAAAAGQEAEAQLAELSGRIAAAETRAWSARLSLTEMAAAFDSTEAGLSRAAVELRARLAAGERCPVCGGTEHAGEGLHDVFSASIETLRRERRVYAQASEAADAEERELRRHEAEVEGRRAAAEEAFTAAERARAAGAAEFAALLPGLEAACAAAGLASPPRAPDEGAEAALAALCDEAARRRAALAPELARMRGLRADHDARVREREALRRDFDAANGRLAAAAGERQAAETRRAEAATESALVGDRLASIRRELAPHLAAAGLGADRLEADAAGVVAAFERAAREVMELRAAQERGGERLQQLAQDLARAAANREAAQSLSDASAVTAVQRRDAVARLRQVRAALLGGEATVSHRARFEAEFAAARQRRDAARAEAAEAATRLGALDGAVTEAEAALDALRQAAAGAAAAFDDACRDSGLAAGTIAGLLAVEEAEREALRRRLAGLDLALATADSALALRRQDLALAGQGFEPDPADHDLGQRLAEREAEAEAAQLARGSLIERLQSDDAAREKAAAIEAEEAALKAEWSVWAEVDAAIGSASGDKFRGFAQAITLDHLVALANTHLTALAPRYRLARSTDSELGLVAIDREMGDEPRSPRSLSGGERFLVSLALALALAGLDGRAAFVDTLFIDEGFGSLDGETLDMAVDALEALQGRGRKVGVITHVAAMIERIAVQVRVEKRGGGRSEVRICAG